MATETPTPKPDLAQLWEQLCRDLNRPQELVLLWFIQAAMRSLADEMEGHQAKLLRIQAFGADAVPLTPPIVPGQTEGSWAADKLAEMRADGHTGDSAQDVAEASQLRGIHQVEKRFAFLCQLHHELRGLQADKWARDMATYLHDRQKAGAP